jgi:superfamily II DNA or RNA helicase
VGLLMEGSYTFNTSVVVATVQSLTPEATQDLLDTNTTPILTVLIDEAHHAVPGSAYERVLVAIEQAAGAQPVAVIGLTATPYRNDERSMLSLLPICAFARTIPEMVQEGYLAPLTWKPVQLELDLAEVTTKRQSGELDYAETTLARHLLRETVTSRLVEHAASLIAQRPTLVFAANVEHADYLNAAFRVCGYSAASFLGAAAGGSGTNCLPAGRVAPCKWSATAACSRRATTFPASQPWSSRGPRSHPDSTCRCWAGACARPRERPTAW